MAAGNRRANQDRLDAERAAAARANAPPVAPATAEIGVKITDERTIVQTKAGAGTKIRKPLRNASNVPIEGR